MRKKFDIWIANLDPKYGTEPGKVRPVIIVQTDLLNDIHPSTLICPLSSKPTVDLNCSTLRVFVPSTDTLLQHDSHILIDQIRAIDNKRLIQKICSLPDKYHKRIQDNLNNMLD